MNIELLHNIKNCNILVFGDYMVDEYIIGSVNRISPEAPVPVIEVTKETKKLGGAGNVINNIISLGGQVKVIGCIGKDSAGDFIMEHFKNNKVNTAYFKQYKNTSTIIKTRVVSKNQQFLRIDEEKKDPILDEYVSFLKSNIDSILNKINVLIISDYAKGAVTKEVSQFLIREAKKRNVPVIVDPKGNDYSKYKGATICTPNLKELSDLYNIKVVEESDITKYGSKLCNEIDLDYLLLTRSEKGISLVDKKKNKKDFPAVAIEVIDVSGAGDTVVATVALLLSLNYSIDDICRLANLAASVVVSKFGTATVSLNELICSISNSGEFKIQNIDTLKYIAEDLREKGKKIVFTNGCFDIFHVGHLRYLKESAKYGDVLIIGVNSDKSVKRLKGNNRPIVNEDERMELLSSLSFVSYVVKFDEDTPYELIKNIKPDIITKGGDYNPNTVVGKDIVEEYGGKVVICPLIGNKSTTNIIEKILEIYHE